MQSWSLSRDRTVLGLAGAFFVLLLAPALAAFDLGRAQEGGDDGPAADNASAQVVQVLETDFKFDPDAIAVKAGTLAFTVRNVGVIEHDLAIETPQRQFLGTTGVLAPGRTGQLEVSLSAGTYVIVCSLIGHREAGMIGTLTVSPSRIPRHSL